MTLCILFFYLLLLVPFKFFFFFFNDTATTEIYTLSLHDALPISDPGGTLIGYDKPALTPGSSSLRDQDRKSTRLNSSHSQISYAVFCLKKKNTTNSTIIFFTTLRYFLSFVLISACALCMIGV